MFAQAASDPKKLSALDENLPLNDEGSHLIVSFFLFQNLFPFYIYISYNLTICKVEVCDEINIY